MRRVRGSAPPGYARRFGRSTRTSRKTAVESGQGVQGAEARVQGDIVQHSASRSEIWGSESLTRLFVPAGEACGRQASVSQVLRRTTLPAIVSSRRGV